MSCDKKIMPEDPRHPSLRDSAHKDRPTRRAKAFVYLTRFFFSRGCSCAAAPVVWPFVYWRRRATVQCAFWCLVVCGKSPLFDFS